MHENQFTMRFCARSENEKFARSVVAAFAAQKDPTLDILQDIKTAVSEAVTNAIIHGYRGREEGEVELSACWQGHVLSITVRDFGAGIADVPRAMEPFFTTSPEGEERSGMGFCVMQAFMDDVRVTSAPGQGTSVILKKSVCAPARADGATKIFETY